MRKLTTTLCLTIAVLLGTPVQAETVFYCQSELSTGLIKEYGTWRIRNFKPSRYTIKFNNDYSKLYGLDKSRPFKCNVPFTNFPNTISCVSGYGNGESFLFEKKMLRFTFANVATSGFVEDSTSTDNLVAGTCQKF